jgi:hypothetical protein
MPTEHSSKHAAGIGLSAEIKKLLRGHESRQARHGVMERLGLNRNDPTVIASDHSFRTRNTFATERAAKGVAWIEVQHRHLQRSVQRHSVSQHAGQVSGISQGERHGRHDVMRSRTLSTPQSTVGPDREGQLRGEARTARQNSTSSEIAARHIPPKIGWRQQAKVFSKLPETNSSIAQLSPQIPGFATQSAPLEVESLNQQAGRLPQFRQGELLAHTDFEEPTELLPEQATSLNNAKAGSFEAEKPLQAKEPVSDERMAAVVKAAVEVQYRAFEEKLIRDFSLRRNR